MKLFKFVSICILIFTSFGVFGQKYELQGNIIESETKQAIPYASVLIRSKQTKNMLGGTTTSDDGSFNLKTDSSEIYLEITFIGFQTKEIQNIEWENNQAKLGKIELSKSQETLDEVKVRAEKSTVEFKLDKRVFNVGKDIASSGAGAMEVLNNVPSVNVDIEGNIKLRGTSGVQILIDGKPTILSDDPANALSSINADMIDKIEVITNPSAKYNAEGSAGIINIVLKKDEKRGFNGSVSVNTGYPNNHSLGGSLNLRTKKFNLFTQFGVGYRTLPYERRGTIIDRIDSTSLFNEGKTKKNEAFANITLGADYYINPYNTLTVKGNYAYEFETQPSFLEFKLYNASNELTEHYTRREKTRATNPKWSFEVQYETAFKKNKDHKLQFTAQGRFFGKLKKSEFSNEEFVASNTDVDQRMITDFNQGAYTFKLDYSLPIKKTMTFETGAMYDMSIIGNDYSVYTRNGDWFYLDSNFSNNFNFNRNVLGVYGTFAYEGEKWGVKTGVRVENTDRRTELENTSETSKRNYTDFFPSLHISYKVSKKFSLQLGYSRRIYRPSLWELNPFFSFQNNFNIHTGNPNLLPEYANSTEFTTIFIFKKVSLNTSVFYIHTNDVTEQISNFANGVNISKPENIGSRHKLGLEFNMKINAAKWLDIISDANYSYFNRLGEYQNQNFDFNGHQFSARLTTKFKLPAQIDIELTGNYQSKYKTVQGEVKGYAFMNFGIRKKLWKGRGVINFTIRDVFASRIRHTIVRQENFELDNLSKRGQFFTLGFSYSFGKGDAMVYSGGKRY